MNSENCDHISMKVGEKGGSSTINVSTDEEGNKITEIWNARDVQISQIVETANGTSGWQTSPNGNTEHFHKAKNGDYKSITTGPDGRSVIRTEVRRADGEYHVTEQIRPNQIVTYRASKGPSDIIITHPPVTEEGTLPCLES